LAADASAAAADAVALVAAAVAVCDAVSACAAAFFTAVSLHPAINERANTAPANPSSLEVVPTNPFILLLLDVTGPRGIIIDRT
jgi:hypothetical protein